MHYHIILTERCNSRCKYCYEKSMNEFENGLAKKWKYDKEVPVESVVSAKKLDKFLKNEDTLIFYGGEPLVNFPKIKEIMDFYKNSNKKINFCMQTNGKLLNIVPKEYLNRFHKILVSIDGNRERTDFNRGKGNYDLVLKNLKMIRENEFKGEIVARMVISKSDILEQVKHIVNLIEKEILDSVHWQIDAGFYKNDFDFEKFSKFVLEYNKEISDLINFWIDYMKQKKIVLKIYPFLGIFENLYYNKKTKLPCGSGYANYTITTNGELSACPIMNSVENFYCGSIEEGIKKEIHCGGKCPDCDYYKICGGRCLYWNHANLWPGEGDELICKTIINLIEEIKKKIPEIRKLISEKNISEKDFEYEKYFGPEIIP